jgi:phage terminase large subunit
MMDAPTIQVPLQPKQLELLRLVEESSATWIGYGGSRGGAKSHGARAVMLLRRLKHPGTRGLIFRRKFEQIWGNHIQPLFDQYPFMREWYHTGHKELTLPNGSVIVFGYAEHPGDINSLQGQQYMDICVDEATHLTEAELVFLKTCNRWPGVQPSQCKMLATMNPGGVGHAFLRRIFIDRQYHDNESAADHIFLQSRAWDNSTWARAALAEANLTEHDYYEVWTDEQRFRFFVDKTDYGRTLNRLPQAMRIGHLLGSWDRFSGQYFDVFDPLKHTKRVEEMGLQPWWPRWVSVDWGFQHPSAVYWHAIADDKTVFTYREFVQSNLSPRMLAAAIIDRSEGEKISAIWLSPDAFARRTDAETIADQLGKALREQGLPFPGQADNDRKGGWMLMYEKLKAEEWRIGDCCTKLIEVLPMLTRDEIDVEDCIKCLGDDPADAARYGLKSHLRPGTRPRVERIEERIDPNCSPTVAMIWRRKLAKREEYKSQPIKFGRRGNNRRRKVSY